MENNQNLSNPPLNRPPDIPDLPLGSYNYIDNKKNWKRILEIFGVVLIAAIPVILSFYKINYSVVRIYQAVSPEDIGTLSSSYGTWGGVIKAAKRIIQPVIIAPTQATPTPTPSPTPYPTVQTTNPTYESQTGEIIYPTATPIILPTEEIIEPSSTPTFTPTPTLTEEYIDPAIAACDGKEKNDRCSYTSQSGNEVHGRCKEFNYIFLVCVSY